MESEIDISDHYHLGAWDLDEDGRGCKSEEVRIFPPITSRGKYHIQVSLFNENCLEFFKIFGKFQLRQVINLPNEMFHAPVSSLIFFFFLFLPITRMKVSLMIC